MATTTINSQHIVARALRPNWWGLIRGELFKVVRQWTTWIALALVLGAIILPNLLILTRHGFIQSDAILHSFYNLLTVEMTLVRVFTGLFLLLVMARIIGLEYQNGTLRILLARGVGRVQLLCAKLLAAVIIALAVLALSLIVSALFALIIASANGDLSALQTFPAQFWGDAGTLILSIGLNMAISILLAAAVSVTGRSLAFGLSAALVFFPIDNIGTLMMQFAFELTNNNFWLNITSYLLGPNLNVLGSVVTGNRIRTTGAEPLYFVDPTTNQAHGVLVDSTHALLVIGVYAVFFAVIAFWLTWKRDVKE